MTDTPSSLIGEVAGESATFVRYLLQADDEGWFGSDTERVLQEFRDARDVVRELNAGMKALEEMHKDDKEDTPKWICYLCQYHNTGPICTQCRKGLREGM